MPARTINQVVINHRDPIPEWDPIAEYESRLARPMTDIERAAVAYESRVIERGVARHAEWLAGLDERAKRLRGI